VVDVTGPQVRYVDCGCLKVASEDLGVRLCEIHDGIAAVVREHGPLEVAAEKVFVHRNPLAAIKLGQARGAALVAAVRAGVTLFEYSPNEVKQAITGRGHADKQQIQHMVRVLLGLARAPASDAADALAVAICHGHVRASRLRLARVAGRRA
jgi:crossover junction endodeoxyribonuclease RuvC